MKFASFLRQGTLHLNRLKKIKTRIEALVAQAAERDLTANQFEELFQFGEEAKTKHSDFKIYLAKGVVPADIEDYDEEKVLSVQDDIADLFISIQVLLKPYRARFEGDTRPGATNIANNSSLKLPPLPLKTFNGSPEQWIAFHSLFESTIHKNDSVPEIEKLPYLLTSLQGEPLDLIKNLPIVEGNYEIAWNILLTRYQNNRKIVTYHINNLIDLPNVTNPSTKNLRSFVSHCQENVQALRALKYDVQSDNVVLSTLLLRKLDSETRKKFEGGREDSQKVPQVTEIIAFLEEECSHMEAACLSQNVSISPKPNFSVGSHNSQRHNSYGSKPSSSKGRSVLLSSTNQGSPCGFCRRIGHALFRCHEFRELSPHDKFDFAQKQRLCFNCLGNSHDLKDCRSTNTCWTCGKRHHTWLHLPSRTTPPKPGPAPLNKLNPASPQVTGTPPNTSKNPVVAFSQGCNSKPTTILLGTTLVHLTSSHGHSLVVRAVVDSASMITCISENTARLLCLNRSYGVHCKVDGLSSCQIKTKGSSQLNILTLGGTPVAQEHPVIILDKITSNLPHSTVPLNVKERFKNLVLADPSFHLPSDIDMLLGADLFGKILTGDHITFDNLPTAMGSVFGYIIVGPSPALSSPEEISVSGLTTLLTTHDVDLHHSLQNFWVLEEVPLQPKPSPEEIFCEKHFQKTHSRDSDGRYVVRLPIKEGHPPLGNSVEIATKRFLSLEKRLNSDPVLKQSYVECMNDYIDSGHIEKVETGLPSEEHFVLPHHAVVKNISSSTKVRVVFDASAKSSNGVSLNEILHSGQKLHNDICDILLKFRFHPIVFACDIRKMFRQVQIHPEDRNYQLLVWRENMSQPLLVYRHTTVVFGFSSSPFLAIRTVKQLVEDEGENYPMAAKALEEQVYVDDLFLGANDMEAAKLLKEQTINLLKRGNFDLRKWLSNCPELISDLPESHQETPLYFQNADCSFFNVLGIKWVPNTDNFTYVLQIPEKAPTKRNILSIVAQIYDPCGWLTPVVFWSKCFLQLLWTLGVQWDEPIPPNLTEKWNKYLAQLRELDNIQIPRYLLLFGAQEVQLHGFCDGSEAGYGAAVYVRCVSSDKVIHTFLLIAKSKVAPLKKISIPRLELCGAYLLAKLLNYSFPIISQHCKIDSVTAWCDSSVTLSWIQTPPYRLKVYVANRVAQIQEWTPTHTWRHVSTHDNPADCASRGILPASLKEHAVWWHGPSWLQQPQKTWPRPNFIPTKKEELPEMKTKALQVLVSTNEPLFLSKFSSWTLLLRVVAYIYRFVENARNKDNKKIGALTRVELDKACVKVCRLVQKSHFQKDLFNLQENKTCSSRLQTLSPILDEAGLIRVGGRIRHSQLPFTAKHPILLPKSHHVTNLVIDYHHLKYLHAGPQLVQAMISQQFWILSARSVIRSRIFKCLSCFRARPKNITQKMGDLPEARLTPSRVFNNCGTDFLGPFLVKPYVARKATPVKVYICLFVCFAVKALHLEVVTNLTSEAFIAALTRFVSRRGLPSNIYCDCGTNYVGASSELQKILKAFFKNEDNKSAISKFSIENHINFNFLPPASPHIGGLWERAVRSIKHHLRRVVGHQVLTLEEFITLSARVEAILNSRPIVPISSDPCELNCLTPGHFLVGGPLAALPEPDWINVPSNRLSRWQLVQSLTQGIWRRWKEEYLYTLQERGKWRTSQANIKIGDMVLIHEPNSPPLSWRMGRVTATLPGPDGLVRVVQLHTSRGQLARPITKVSPLPFDE